MGNKLKEKEQRREEKEKNSGESSDRVKIYHERSERGENRLKLSERVGVKINIEKRDRRKRQIERERGGKGVKRKTGESRRE